MIAILKGDTSADIAVALAEGFDYSGATVRIQYQSVIREFTNISGSTVLQLQFTAKETAAMILGAHRINIAITYADGRKITVPTQQKIIVTDVAEEVYSDDVITIGLKGALSDVAAVPARYTDEELRNKVNEIISRFGGKQVTQ